MAASIGSGAGRLRVFNAVHRVLIIQIIAVLRLRNPPQPPCALVKLKHPKFLKRLGRAAAAQKFAAPVINIGIARRRANQRNDLAFVEARPIADMREINPVDGEIV